MKLQGVSSNNYSKQQSFKAVKVSGGSVID